MAPEHRALIAYVAASLKAGRALARVYDHDGGRETALGGAVSRGQIEVMDAAGPRISGPPDALLLADTRSHVRLALEGEGFGGYDYASQAHFKGVFGAQGSVQVFDYETGRYHAYHVS